MLVMSATLWVFLMDAGPVIGLSAGWAPHSPDRKWRGVSRDRRWQASPEAV
nr:MAG TPA: hypothetical protein [Caudoviricetes sp.]